MSAFEKAVHKNGGIVKVIFENAYLTKDEIIALCKIANEAGVDYIKTSTGYAPSGASLEDVKLMRAYADPSVKIKASGGIRSLSDTVAFIRAGADRIGTSSLVKICEEYISQRSE
jgi:deoxyribose-phosphate aldolase